MKKILFLIPSILLFVNAHARNNQLRQSLKDSLQLAADKLYEQNNRDFIAVEALKDGILKPGENFIFKFDSDTIKFEGKKLSKFQKQQYSQRFRGYLVKTNTLRSKGSTTSTISLKDIFDTTSTLWVNTSYKLAQKSANRTDSEAHSSDVIVLQMLDDKLVDTSKDIKILYSSEGITVNGAKIPETYKQKYTTLFIELFNQHSNPSNFVSIIYSAHPKSLRYPKPGLEIRDK